jgi:DNA-binding response OmpR family regulator
MHMPKLTPTARTNTIDEGAGLMRVHLRWRREKVEEDSAQPTRITVRGVAYRFEG